MPQLQPASDAEASPLQGVAGDALRPAASGRPNPGSVDRVDEKAKGVLTLDTFDGFRFDFNKPVSVPTNPYAPPPSSCVVSHHVMMGSTQAPSGYEFGAMFQKNAPLSIMMGRVGAGGRMIARYIAQPTPDWLVRVNAQLTNEPHQSTVQGDATYSPPTSDFALTLKGGSGGMAGVGYMQSITGALAMGGELQYVGARRMSVLSACLRHRHSKGHETGVSVSSMGQLSASYVHQANQRCLFASEFLFNKQNYESIFRSAYEYKLTRNTIKGSVASNGQIQATLEREIGPGLAFVLSGEMDHKKEEYRFGYGLRIGQ